MRVPEPRPTVFCTSFIFVAYTVDSSRCMCRTRTSFLCASRNKVEGITCFWHVVVVVVVVTVVVRWSWKDNTKRYEDMSVKEVVCREVKVCSKIKFTDKWVCFPLSNYMLWYFFNFKRTESFWVIFHDLEIVRR